jgi:hypothetical protein
MEEEAKAAVVVVALARWSRLLAVLPLLWCAL